MKTKLFAQYSRINILVTIAIFLVASLAFYFTLNYVQVEQVDDDLRIEEKEIELYVKQYDQLPKTFSVDDQLIEFTPSATPFTQRYFKRINLEQAKGDIEDFRQLIFGVQAGGNWYKVTVSKSLEDTDHLIMSILWITCATILLILFASFIINRFVLKRLWKPFFKTLDVVKEFRIDKVQPMTFPTTSTEEFSKMIDTLEQTTKQAQFEYLSLKTFSENASHEIQTPIAIIQSKLDLLIQDEDLTENQSQVLQKIYAAIQRLARLNTSLLLLAKIENRQYHEVQLINMKTKLEDKVYDFNELWQSKQIKPSFSLEESHYRMNEELADILLNNLLRNATNHNYIGGGIFISLNDQGLTVANTSQELPLNRTYMFTRFYKAATGKVDNGLGLSIIKQICDASGITVFYEHTGGQHSFSLKWKKL